MKGSWPVLRTIDHHASPAVFGGVVVKGLARLGNCLRHGLRAKRVDASLFG